MLKQLWNDDAGYIISTEMLLIFVILVLGLIAGLANLRAAIVSELTESAQAILNIQQGFAIAGVTGCSGSSQGSNATDLAGTSSLQQSFPVANNIGAALCP
jgi:hypothetical protein